MKKTHKFLHVLKGCKISLKGYTLKEAKNRLKRMVNNHKEWVCIKKEDKKLSKK
jgi:hypothetical protein